MDKDMLGSKEALAHFLDCAPTELEEYGYKSHGLSIFSLGGEEYAVGTEEAATRAVCEEITESLWAFKPEFLSSLTGFPTVIFKALQGECENSNEAVLALVEKSCGLSKFVKAAVNADGRGHFLSPYDGKEIQEGEYLLYRVN